MPRHAPRARSARLGIAVGVPALVLVILTSVLTAASRAMVTAAERRVHAFPTEWPPLLGEVLTWSAVPVVGCLVVALATTRPRRVWWWPAVVAAGAALGWAALAGGGLAGSHIAGTDAVPWPGPGSAWPAVWTQDGFGMTSMALPTDWWFDGMVSSAEVEVLPGALVPVVVSVCLFATALLSRRLVPPRPTGNRLPPFVAAVLAMLIAVLVLLATVVALALEGATTWFSEGGGLPVGQVAPWVLAHTTLPLLAGVAAVLVVAGTGRAGWLPVAAVALAVALPDLSPWWGGADDRFLAVGSLDLACVLLAAAAAPFARAWHRLVHGPTEPVPEGRGPDRDQAPSSTRVMSPVAGSSPVGE